MKDLRSFLERVSAGADLAALMTEDGIALRKSGNRLTACCPFHGEKTPSFVLYRDERYHCYGCHENGDSLDYLQKKRGLSFWEAAKLIADKLKIPMPEQAEQEQAEIDRERELEACLDAAANHYHRLLTQNQGALLYLIGRGLTEETITEQRIGFCDGSVPDGFDTATLTEAGLINDKGNARLWGRITFPVRKHGRIVNIVGRAFERPDQTPKYLNVRADIVPHGIERLKGPGPVGLVEGIIDRLLLEQGGVPATATIGTFVRDEWAQWFKKNVQYVCLYDNDANQAGQKANIRVSDKLLDWECRVSVGVLPEGMDPADVVKAHGIGAIQQAIQQAQPFIDFIIAALPFTENPLSASDLMREQVFGRLWKLPDLAQSHYVDALATKFRLRKEAVRKAWQTFAASQRDREKQADRAEEKSAPGGVSLVKRADNPISFNPAQFFVPGQHLAGFTVYAETADSTELVPIIITNDRRALPLRPDTVREYGLTFRANRYPSEIVRWPLGTDYQFNVHNWLEGTAPVSAAHLYRAVRGMFEHHIHWPDRMQGYYDLATLWSLGTYLHQGMDSYPYLHIRAIRDSGKTTLLRVMEAVSFNGEMAADITESTISRGINSDSKTLFIDEAEGFRRNSRDENSISTFRVLNAGYKAGAAAQKAGSKKDGFKPEIFSLFSAKALASIEPIDPVLETRCINVAMLKTDRKVPPFLPEELAHGLYCLRGHAYCWALTDWEQALEIYRTMETPEGWLNRGWELWKPMIGLARYFTPHVGRDLEAELLTLATALKKAKDDREKEQSVGHRIIGAFIDYMQGSGHLHKDDGWLIPSSVLLLLIERELGLKDYTAEKLSRFLFDEAHICEDRSADKVKQVTASAMKRVWHYRVIPERLCQQAIALYGWGAELWREPWVTGGAPNGEEILSDVFASAEE